MIPFASAFSDGRADSEFQALVGSHVSFVSSPACRCPQFGHQGRKDHPQLPPESNPANSKTAQKCPSTASSHLGIPSFPHPKDPRLFPKPLDCVVIHPFPPTLALTLRPLPCIHVPTSWEILQSGDPSPGAVRSGT